ncbi:hypothetical protein AB0N29_15250 [Nocardioides sp. NPDC092400]|uniref:hypothetical protein n=1 Tax=Nocardioides sp. NPDC092400 TaxID=3155196 RepID=UPI00341870F5
MSSDDDHAGAPLTDAAVARLPLAAGRAELLEEIMRTAVTDRPTAPAPSTPPRRTRWLVPVAAAAAVATVAAGTLWWTGGDGAAPRPAAPAGSPSAAAEAPFRAVLDAPGWTATYVYEGEGGDGDGDGEVAYEKGSASVEVSWRPAAAYQTYLEDRRHIVDPPADGEPVEVLGLTGQLWPYSPDDHTVIRPVERGHTLEVRGSGMDRDAFEALLGRLRLVGRADFEAALPAEFVTSGEREAAIEEILDGIAAASGQERTFGEETPPITSDQADPYQLGAEVTGQVACAWLRELRDARRVGDDGRAQVAVDVLGSARSWPVLFEMATSGEYPEYVWDYTDDAARGQVPEGFEGGLGC